MPNGLFDQLNQPHAARPQMNDGGFSQLIADVRKMQQTFKGDPRDAVQRLLNSGEMTQEQFNQYAQLANQIMAMM